MPRYRFEIEGHAEDRFIDLPDDARAWAELLEWCNDILRDVEGEAPRDTHVRLRVFEGERPVAEIAIASKRLYS